MGSRGELLGTARLKSCRFVAYQVTHVRVDVGGSWKHAASGVGATTWQASRCARSRKSYAPSGGRSRTGTRPSPGRSGGRCRSPGHWDDDRRSIAGSVRTIVLHTCADLRKHARSVVPGEAPSGFRLAVVVDGERRKVSLTCTNVTTVVTGHIGRDRTKPSILRTLFADRRASSPTPASSPTRQSAEHAYCTGARARSTRSPGAAAPAVPGNRRARAPPPSRRPGTARPRRRR